MQKFKFMKTEISPCLWFNGQAKEAAEFYCSIFQNAEILSSDDVITHFAINRRNYSALNGGPMVQVNESISLMVYCGGDAEIERLYKLLQEGGEVNMELKSYQWSRKYAWVKDKFGVSWQLDVDPINNPQNIVPTILFVNENKNKIKEAFSLYESIFPNSKMLMEVPYPEESYMDEGSIMFCQFKLNGNIFNAMSSSEHHDFEINEAVSFVLKCDDQEEIDMFWAELSKDGGKPGKCGWIKDKFGISWQVIPSKLEALMLDPDKAKFAAKAFLKMDKFIIADLEE